MLAPTDAPVPISSIGYRSHFLAEDELAAAGGAVAYFTAWLEREARSTAWAKADAVWSQGDLFARRD